MTPDQMTELAARLRDAADLIESMTQRVLDEPVAFRDPETGDFSRVCRVGWQPLYLYPQSTSDAQQVPLDDQIMAACYSFRHDFGLLPRHDQTALMDTAREWARCFGIRSEK